MRQTNEHHGKREAPRTSLLSQCKEKWTAYGAWVKGLDKKALLRLRLLQIAGVVLVLALICGVALAQWIRMPDLSTGGVLTDGIGEDVDFSGAEEPAPVQSGRKEGVYTFLIAGRDTSSGSTDTMLLISYDTVNKTLYGLNLPRDTMINVSTTSKRLNAVYSYNKGKDKETQVEKGMTALKEQVAKLTGITPDFYVLVEWKAIGELVDALGGVEFEVPFDMDYDDPAQDLHIHQKAGLRTLSGDDAMQVIRHRKNNDGSHSNGDVGRLQIQQSFLKAVAKKCLQPATFLKVPTLAQIFFDNVQTDLTVGNILAFAQQAYGMDAEEDVDFSTAPLADTFMYNGASLVTLDGEELVKVLNEGMNPYQQDIQVSDLELLVHHSNGSFTVTRGTLADSAMGKASSSGSSSGTSSATTSGTTSGGSTTTPAAGQTTQDPAQGDTQTPDDSSDTTQPEETDTPEQENPSEQEGSSEQEPDTGGEGDTPSDEGEEPPAVDTGDSQVTESVAQSTENVTLPVEPALPEVSLQSETESAPLPEAA
jgi:LCP family protein required for cell wall assembly